jgi:hypothetical protein
MLEKSLLDLTTAEKEPDPYQLYKITETSKYIFDSLLFKIHKFSEINIKRYPIENINEKTKIEKMKNDKNT